jgi:hypothetical protein
MITDNKIPGNMLADGNRIEKIIARPEIRQYIDLVYVIFIKLGRIIGHR